MIRVVYVINKVRTEDVRSTGTMGGILLRLVLALVLVSTGTTDYGVVLGRCAPYYGVPLRLLVLLRSLFHFHPVLPFLLAAGRHCIPSSPLLSSFLVVPLLPFLEAFNHFIQFLSHVHHPL